MTTSNTTTISHITIETGVPLAPQDALASQSCTMVDFSKKVKAYNVKLLFMYGLGSGIIIQLAILGFLQISSLLCWFQQQKQLPMTFGQEDLQKDDQIPEFQHPSCYWLTCIAVMSAFLYLFFVNIVLHHNNFDHDYDGDEEARKYNKYGNIEKKNTEGVKVSFHYFIFGFGCMVSL